MCPVAFSPFPTCKADDSSLPRLDDVETKLAETEKEADKARKDSKSARDTFNDVKQRRYGTSSVCCYRGPVMRSIFLLAPNCSTKPTITYQNVLTRSTRI